MPKRAISLTLDDQNLVWLEGLTARAGARSLSDMVDRLLTAARESGAAASQSARSVVGTIDIDTTDPLLEKADAAVHQTFERSLARPFLVRERRSRFGRKQRRG